MGLMDTFAQDDRVQLKVNDLLGWFRVEARTHARNEVMLNCLKNHLPYSHILTMIGESDPIAENDSDVCKEERK